MKTKKHHSSLFFPILLGEPFNTISKDQADGVLIFSIVQVLFEFVWFARVHETWTCEENWYVRNKSIGKIMVYFKKSHLFMKFLFVSTFVSEGISSLGRF